MSGSRGWSRAAGWLAGVALAGGVAAAPQELVVLTWSEYVDPEVVTAFEQAHDARVRFVYFEEDDERDKLLLEAGATGFDVVCVNEVSVPVYVARGWLAPLTDAEVPNLKHVDARWLDDVPEVRGHAVPYFWGTLGIAWRADLVEGDFTSWRQLFEPAPALSGRIDMLSHNRGLVGMALKALGHSVNSAVAAELDAADALLLAQKPHVRRYGYMRLDETSPLVTGETYAAMAYSGDALMLKGYNDNIRYVLPKEGGNLWLDALAVLANSPRRALAAAYIDFLNEPRNAARNAVFVHYATPNTAALPLTPAAYREDPVIHPSAPEIGRSEFYRALPPRATRRYADIELRVTR